MEYVTLKNSDLKVSRLCMGGCPMGGYGWGDTKEQEFIEAISIALDHGVNFFDTANTYGFGQSEEILAKGLGKNRHKAIIQSKFGVRVMEDMVGRKTIYDNSPDYIRRALEGTLKRLGSDYIDIYTIHYRDEDTPIDVVVETLKKLQKEGKIRYFGLSNIHNDSMDELKPFKGDFVCCQDEYSLACRSYERDLKIIEKELSVTPLTWGSLGQGILTGKYNKNTKFDNCDRRSRATYVNFYGKKLEKNLEIVETMKWIATKHNKPLSAVAVRFILDKLTSSVVLTGVKKPSQMEDNIAGCDWRLNRDEMKMLDSISRVITVNDKAYTG